MKIHNVLLILTILAHTSTFTAQRQKSYDQKKDIKQLIVLIKKITKLPYVLQKKIHEYFPDIITERTRLKGHNNDIINFEFHPQFRQLKSISSNFITRIWNIPSRQCLKKWKGNITKKERLAECMAFGNKITLYGDWNGTVTITDGKKKQLASIKDDDPTIISCIALAPNNKVFMYGTTKGIVQYCHLNGFHLSKLARIKTPKNTIPESITFSPEKKLVAYGLSNGMLILAPPFTSNPKRWTKIKAHKGPIACVSFCPKGKTLASGSREGSIKIWNLKGYCLYSLKANTTITCMRFSPDSTMLATSAWNTIDLWTLYTSKSAFRRKKSKKSFPPVKNSMKNKKMTKERPCQTSQACSIQ